MILEHKPTKTTIHCGEKTGAGLMEKYSDDYRVFECHSEHSEESSTVNPGHIPGHSELDSESKELNDKQLQRITAQYDAVVEQNMSLQQDCRVLRKAFELYYIDCYIAEKGIRPSDESVKSIVTHYIKEGIDALTGERTL